MTLLLLQSIALIFGTFMLGLLLSLVVPRPKMKRHLIRPVMLDDEPSIATAGTKSVADLKLVANESPKDRVEPEAQSGLAMVAASSGAVLAGLATSQLSASDALVTPPTSTKSEAEAPMSAQILPFVSPHQTDDALPSARPLSEALMGINEAQDTEASSEAKHEEAKIDLAYLAVPITPPELAQDSLDSPVSEPALDLAEANKETEISESALADAVDPNVLTKLDAQGVLIKPEVSVLATMAPENVAAAVAATQSILQPIMLDAPQGQDKDNLQLISGIGTDQERELNVLGIYHYWQVASWGPEQISWLAGRLKSPDRIINENWMAQAVKLGNLPKKVSWVSPSNVTA